MIKYFSSLFVIFLIYIAHPLAKENTSESLIVEADNSIEFFEKQKYYLATGNAVAIKNNTTLKADKIKAFFEENDQIQLIHGLGKVSILKKNILSEGEDVKYDLKKQTLLFSGKFQSFKTPKIYIESNKLLSYDNIKKIAFAKGNVKIIFNNNDKIFANQITAKFDESDDSLLEAVAKGNIEIITNSGNKSFANYAKFNKKTSLVELIGDVKVLQNNSSISGEKGVTNLKTGVSKILTSKTNNRVKGKFLPYKNK